MIGDADRLGGTPARATALACVEAGIEAALPERVVGESVAFEGDLLRVDGASYDLSAYDEVVILGGGKAAGALAAALERLLGGRIDGGAVVTTEPADLKRATALEGDHPVPGERNVEAARRVLARAESAGERTLVLAPVTGGGSALLAAPADGVDLPGLRSVTEALLESGADIDGINAVRKHLSRIKGGGLARAAAPATVVGLLVSDVVGDDAGVIASGPTAPDGTTHADAIAVLERNGVDAPPGVRDRLERGARGDLPETPDATDPVFERVDNHVLAGGFTALSAAREVARDRGYRAAILSSRVRGEAREAARTQAAIAEEVRATGNPIEPPAVVLSGGETTVTVRGDGRGGPNQEFALAAALELPDRAALAAVDTDGRDGGTDAAGALVSAATVDDPGRARAALADNDSHGYLSGRGALIHTGPTGTNVNDLRVLVVEAGADGR